MSTESTEPAQILSLQERPELVQRTRPSAQVNYYQPSGNTREDRLAVNHELPGQKEFIPRSNKKDRLQPFSSSSSSLCRTLVVQTTVGITGDWHKQGKQGLKNTISWIWTNVIHHGRVVIINQSSKEILDKQSQQSITGDRVDVRESGAASKSNTVTMRPCHAGHVKQPNRFW